MTMIKKLILVVGVIGAVVASGGDAWGQKYDQHKDPLTPYSPALQVLKNQADRLDSPTMTEKDLDAIVSMYANHLRQHPEDKAHCYYMMGGFMRFCQNLEVARPAEAFQHFQDCLHSLNPDDSLNRGVALYRMSQCHSFMGQNMEQAIRYLSNSATILPKNASPLGDMYIFGWGAKQDFYLASLNYDIAQRNGAPTSYENNFCLFYMVMHPVESYEDSVALALFERGLYQAQINQNQSAANSAIMAAAQMGFAPAEYELGWRIENHFITYPGLNSREWFQSAYEKGYVPAALQYAKFLEPNAQKDSRGAERYYNIMKIAEENGGAIAKIEMGNLYAKGNKFGFPKKNPMLAHCYYQLAYKISNYPPALDALKKLEQTYKPSREEMIKIRMWVDSAYIYYNEQCNLLFKMIDASDEYSEPVVYEHNSFFQQNPHMLQMVGTREADELHARQYQIVYNLYADRLKTMSLMSNSERAYKESFGEYYQLRMRELRQRSSKMPVHIVKATLWETWDGN